MKHSFELIKWAGWVLFIMCVTLHNCNNVTEITIPEKPGSFAPDVEVVHVPVDTIIEVPKWYKDIRTEIQLQREAKEREERIKLYEEEVEWMREEFAYMDSVQKANAYKEATAVKQFRSVFDNDTITIDIRGIVRGEVKEIKPYYLIKEQKVIVPDSRKNNMLFGFGAGTNFELNTFTAKANLSLLTKKQNIYTLSYQRVGNQNFGLIEYNFSLLK